MRSLFVYLVLAASMFTSAGICLAQQTDSGRAHLTSEVEGGPGEVHSLDALRQFNSSLIALSKRVTPAVVQIMVTGYAPTQASGRNNNTGVITREHALGSGVILASDGYIITNAHVVEGAQRIQVALAERDGTSPIGRRALLPFAARRSAGRTCRSLEERDSLSCPSRFSRPD